MGNNFQVEELLDQPAGGNFGQKTDGVIFCLLRKLVTQEALSQLLHLPRGFTVLATVSWLLVSFVVFLHSLLLLSNFCIVIRTQFFIQQINSDGVESFFIGWPVLKGTNVFQQRGGGPFIWAHLSDGVGIRVSIPAEHGTRDFAQRKPEIFSCPQAEYPGSRLPRL